jgi:hypothetical protein
MQIMSTRVATEDQMMTVEFLGEGGELVSVVMSNADQAIASENALEHAKALLAQVAAFGEEPEATAINTYDAISNGNFDAIETVSTSELVVADESVDAVPSDVEPETEITK